MDWILDLIEELYSFDVEPEPFHDIVMGPEQLYNFDVEPESQDDN